MVNLEVYPLRPPHVFDIVTSSMTYYVGVDMTGALPRDLKPEHEVECEQSDANTVEPLDKGPSRIRITSVQRTTKMCPLFRGSTALQGTVDLIPMCPLFRGSTALQGQ